MAVSNMPMMTQMLLFGNDAAQITYSDGSQLQLSPCGAAFVHTKQVRHTDHPLQDLHRVQQRTQFVTSEFKGKVLEALEFRNRFAERPYICAELLDENDIVNVHSDVDHFRWPVEADPGSVKVHQDGSVCVTAMDGHASLTLAPQQQEFTVKYLAKVGAILTRDAGSTHGRIPMGRANRFLDADMEMDGSFTGMLQNQLSKRCKDEGLPGNKGKADAEDEGTRSDKQNKSEQNKSPKIFYYWMIQHFSVAACPRRWEHALKLVSSVLPGNNANEVNADGMQINSSDDSQGNQEKMSVSKEREKRSTGGKVITSLPPTTLTLSCRASHLHKWNSVPPPGISVLDDVYNVRQEKLKIIYVDGVVYRLNWAVPPSIEVCPGDGSMIRSKGPTGCFFRHYRYTNSAVEERVYSTENPPPDTARLQYSIRNLINQASRLYYHMTHQSFAIIETESTCCWKVKPTLIQPTVPSPASLLEETQVPELGRFSAFTDGRVRIVFADRTMLDMKWDFTKRLKKQDADNSGFLDEVCDIENDPPHPSLSLPKIRAHQTVPNGACRLLLPNGQYQLVSLHQPCGFYRYVSVAMEWAAWVNSSPNERLDFYQGRVTEFNKARAVNAELKKIETFNYLLENTHIPSRHNLGPLPGSQIDSSKSHGGIEAIPGPRVGPAMIQEVLKRTSQTINDISSILDKK
ncbi:uncharacterized protein C5orf34 homolog [Ptychodera flava]|uniref:uncharacterized protein C5orf34 homolog n=1 Tax=Ptychodera flava TaxID=63121 RepID=UPI00396A0A19